MPHYVVRADLWSGVPLETEIILTCQLIGKLTQCDFIASEKRLDCSKFINVRRDAMRPFFGATTLQVILDVASRSKTAFSDVATSDAARLPASTRRSSPAQS